MSKQELLDGMNHALNREISTFLRYMVQAATIKGAQWESVRTMYEGEVPDEVGHAQYLANTIVMLGGSPKLQPDLSSPPGDVREMLRRDIEQERVDVEHYSKLAHLAERAGLMGVRMQMEEQAADEERHGLEMQRMLG